MKWWRYIFDERLPGWCKLLPSCLSCPAHCYGRKLHEKEILGRDREEETRRIIERINANKRKVEMQKQKYYEFKEYLRGVFEINSGIENDPDVLARIHAPELLRLAKEIDSFPQVLPGPETCTTDIKPSCPILADNCEDLEKEAEAYWKAQGGGSHAQWDKYKAVVKHFTEWQKKQIAKYNEENNICCMNFDDIEEARLGAYEEGKADMLKEMKRKAQECEIIWSYNETPIPDCTFEQMKSLLQNADALVGDKVKIIIIKDDERNT